MMKNGEIDFIVNTPSSHESREDEVVIRSAAVANKISHCTNLAAAEASVKAIRSLQELEFKVTPLQDYYL
jgi:carbamoyl-phosphate synthase large subunit